jgi:hypothetical protein
MKTAMQNPYLREIKHALAERIESHTAYEDLVDEVEHVLAIVCTMAKDTGIGGVGDANCDRESPLYERLLYVHDHYVSTPGDLYDAVEALEFIVSLGQED